MVEHHRNHMLALTLEEYNKLELKRPLTDWPAGHRAGAQPKVAEVQEEVRKSVDEKRLKRKRDEYARRKKEKD